MSKKVLLFFTFAILMLAPVNVNAVGEEITDSGSSLGICSFIGPICDALNISTVGSGEEAGKVALNFATGRINQVLSVIFIGIIIISVFIIIQAGVKYIRSQGVEGEIEDAKKSIKAVFVGIAVLFVGIIGMILVLSFFGGTGLLGTDQSLDSIFNTESSSSGTQTCPDGRQISATLSCSVR